MFVVSHPSGRGGLVPPWLVRSGSYAGDVVSLHSRGLCRCTSTHTNRNKAQIHKLWESVGLVAPAALVVFILCLCFCSSSFRLLHSRCSYGQRLYPGNKCFGAEVFSLYKSTLLKEVSTFHKVIWRNSVLFFIVLSFFMWQMQKNKSLVFRWTPMSSHDTECAQNGHYILFCIIFYVHVKYLLFKSH